MPRSTWFILRSGTPYNARTKPAGAREATDEEVELVPLWPLTRTMEGRFFLAKLQGEGVEPVEGDAPADPEPPVVDGDTDVSDEVEGPSVVGKLDTHEDRG